MVVHNELVSSVLVVVKEQHGITVAHANYGTTMPIRAFITVMIVVFVGKVEVLGRTSFTARYVSKTMIRTWVTS